MEPLEIKKGDVLVSELSSKLNSEKKMNKRK